MKILRQRRNFPTRPRPTSSESFWKLSRNLSSSQSWLDRAYRRPDMRTKPCHRRRSSAAEIFRPDRFRQSRHDLWRLESAFIVHWVGEQRPGDTFWMLKVLTMATEEDSTCTVNACEPLIHPIEGNCRIGAYFTPTTLRHHIQEMSKNDLQLSRTDK